MSAAATAVGSDALVAGLFPPAVLATCAPIDVDAAALLPEERVLVARAVAKRQREFPTRRRCARALLARL
ncbi:MAG: 4'-phosphopantetheinyl transferase, partial [Proteobacteria bacterium]